MLATLMIRTQIMTCSLFVCMSIA